MTNASLSQATFIQLRWVIFAAVLSDDSNDFGSAGDVYDAVGEIISSSAPVADADVKGLCAALAAILVKEWGRPRSEGLSGRWDCRGSANGRVEFESEGGHRVLPGAVDMAKTTAAPEPELTSIFMVKKEEKTNVDAKKLARVPIPSPVL